MHHTSRMDLRFLLNESPSSLRQPQNASFSSTAGGGPGNRGPGPSTATSLRPVPFGAAAFPFSRPSLGTREPPSSSNPDRKPRAPALRPFGRTESHPASSHRSGTTRRTSTRPAPVRSPTASRRVAAEHHGPSDRPDGADASSAGLDPVPIKKLSKVVVGQWAWFCSLCGKEFSSSGHCKTHISTVHLKKKEYVCNYCSMAFGQSGTLSRHIGNKHKNLKDYRCPNPRCDKAFNTKWSAKSHNEAVHLGLKPYACRSPQCSQSFAERWNRKKHETKVHKLFVERAEPSPLRRRSSGSAPASSPVTAAPAPLTPPTAAIELTRAPPTPRPRPRRGPDAIEPVTPQAPVLRSSRDFYRRGGSPPTEPLTPQAFAAQIRSHTNMDSTLNLLALGQFSSARRDTHAEQGANLGRVPIGARFLPYPSVKPSRGLTGGRRDASKRSKSAGPAISTFGFLRGSGKERTGNEESASDKTASSRHSRLRKAPK